MALRRAAARCCQLQQQQYAAAAAAATAPTTITAALWPAQLAAAAAARQQQQQRRAYGAHHHGTTVLCVRHGGEVVLMADGQISAGSKVVKPNARKLRRLATEPAPSLGGFAGSTADGLTLFERLEQRLEEHPGQLRRAAVELAKLWRQDRVLRHLEAVMIVADAATCLEVSGKGELLEPADGVHAIGSGARFAVAAARALMTVPGLAPLDIAARAMRIAADRCVYTNDRFFYERIAADGGVSSGRGVGLGPLVEDPAPAPVEADAEGAGEAAAAGGAGEEAGEEAAGAGGRGG